LTNITDNRIVFRLTALWALAESGLGGWMHALGLPFTGIFIGGFAVIIVSILASPLLSSTGQAQASLFSRIVKATFIVLLVKAAVSPQSPPPAYIAVAFQGIIGAVFFKFFPFRPACILLGIIAMIESAVQRVIIATIIFGRSLWEAIDSFFNGVVKELHLPGDLSFSFWIIALYVALYAVWGLILGLWMIKLPAQIKEKAKTIHQQMRLDTSPEIAPAVKKKSVMGKVITILLVLIFICVVFYFGQESMGRAAYVVLRSIAVIAFLIFIFNPLFRYLMQLWLARTNNSNNSAVKDVLTTLPELRSNVKPAFRRASIQHKGLARYKEFVLTLIILSLYPKTDER
jgi:hypothetical protein